MSDGVSEVVITVQSHLNRIGAVLAAAHDSGLDLSCMTQNGGCKRFVDKLEQVRGRMRADVAEGEVARGAAAEATRGPHKCGICRHCEHPRWKKRCLALGASSETSPSKKTKGPVREFDHPGRKWAPLQEGAGRGDRARNGTTCLTSEVRGKSYVVGLDGARGDHTHAVEPALVAWNSARARGVTASASASAAPCCPTCRKRSTPTQLFVSGSIDCNVCLESKSGNEIMVFSCKHGICRTCAAALKRSH